MRSPFATKLCAAHIQNRYILILAGARRKKLNWKENKYKTDSGRKNVFINLAIMTNPVWNICLTWWYNRQGSRSSRGSHVIYRVIDRLGTEFLRGTMGIYLYFVRFLYIEMTQALAIPLSQVVKLKRNSRLDDFPARLWRRWRQASTQWRPGQWSWRPFRICGLPCLLMPLQRHEPHHIYIYICYPPETHLKLKSHEILFVCNTRFSSSIKMIG